MDNTKFIFCASDKLSLESELQAFLNTENEIYIEIDMGGCPPSFITLNKETAIKFVKHLKREIAKIEVEVANG